MPREDVNRPGPLEDRGRALTVGAFVIVLCFLAGLVVSLRGIGLDIAPSRAPQGSLQPRIVDGMATYVRVEDGGYAVACSTTYTSSSCSTVGIILPSRTAKR